MRPTNLIPLLLLLSCAYSPEEPQVNIGIQDIIVHDNTFFRWYRDSTLNNFIIPKEWEDDTGMVVIHVGNPDYTKTLFPDTFWGTYHSYFWPSETLSCVQCDCEKVNDTVVYDFKWYFDSLEIEFN